MITSFYELSYEIQFRESASFSQEIEFNENMQADFKSGYYFSIFVIEANFCRSIVLVKNKLVRFMSI